MAKSHREGRHEWPQYRLRAICARVGCDMTRERYPIHIEGSGQASGYSHERVLVSLERAQGFGQLKDLPCKLPVGCRRGGCGVCRVRVTSGEYRADTMSRAHISAADEQAGLVLSCCIYPLSELSLRLEPAVAVKDKGQKAK